MSRMFAFNVIPPVRPGDRKHHIQLKIAIGETVEEARAKVEADSYSEDIINYRNDFEPDDVICWAHQLWTKAAVANLKNVTRGTKRRIA